VDGRGHLVGILTSSDLIGELLDQLEHSGRFRRHAGI